MGRVETRDLVDFGFEPEFAGRLPVRVALGELSAADLERILGGAEESILKQYRDDFAGYGIELEVTPDAIREVAQRAHAEGTGARGLMTVLERVFRDLKFELPSRPVRRLVVTAEVVRDPGGALEALVREASVGAAPGAPEQKLPEARAQGGGQDRKAPGREQLPKQVGMGELRLSPEYLAAVAEVDGFAEAFAREHHLNIRFTTTAIEFLRRLALARGTSVTQLCQERLRDLGYALSLVARNTGRTQFSIAQRLVRNPERELSRLVRESVARAAQ
jgi:hypothetical protein